MSKLKELQRRATIAWSASSQQPDLIAAGTAAGTIGLDFDISSQLEIYSLDITNNSNNLTLAGNTTSHNRFHKLVWGQAAGDRTHGIIAGGMDNGAVTLWDPAKIIAKKEEETTLGSAQKHTGAVQALDFNPYQHNLLASGATDSEIFIWDLSNPSAPSVYTPGQKPQQSSDVSCVAWNKKVPHILASSSHSGVTFIWDLKAKRSIISFTDQTKSQVRAIAWNPQEATQVLTASEDDASPFLQLWDLRNIYTPIRRYAGHTRGIWGVSWCPFDNSLLVSCGKDNRTICWSAETGEQLCDVESGADSGVWNVDVQWSPRIPAVLSTSSLEGKVTIYALQDVCERNVKNEFIGGTQTPVRPPNFRHTPSWIRRPVGASFGFGGSLVSFSHNATTKKSQVKVRNIVTEQTLISRSERLEEVVNSGSFEQFCDEKIASSAAEGEDKYTWRFLKVLFDKDGRHKILDYLGLDEAQAIKDIKEVEDSLPEETQAKEQAEEEEEKEEERTPEVAEEVEEKTETQAEEVTEPEQSEPQEEEEEEEQRKDVSGLFGEDTFSFSIPEQARSKPTTPRAQTPPPPFANRAPPTPTPPAAVTPRRKSLGPIHLNTSTPGPESAITKALMIGNFAAAVDLCIRLGRMADALVLAACGGESLWTKTQERYFAAQKAPYTNVMAAIVHNDLQELVEQADLADWKATLAILCTYAKSTELPKLATVLGDRLVGEGNVKAATLCFICAGRIDKTVNVWISTTKETKDPHQALQDLIEKISIFRHAVNASDDLDDLLARKYSEYAEILASQGKLSTSLRYLSFLNDPKYTQTSGAILLDRVFNASSRPSGTAPKFPFERKEINLYKDQRIAQPAEVPQQQQQQQQQQQTLHGAHGPQGHTGPQGHAAGGGYPPQGGVSAFNPPQGAFGGPPSGYPPQHSHGAHAHGGQFSASPFGAPQPADSLAGGQPRPSGPPTSNPYGAPPTSVTPPPFGVPPSNPAAPPPAAAKPFGAYDASASRFGAPPPGAGGPVPVGGPQTHMHGGVPHTHGGAPPPTGPPSTTGAAPPAGHSHGGGAPHNHAHGIAPPTGPPSAMGNPPSGAFPSSSFPPQSNPPPTSTPPTGFPGAPPTGFPGGGAPPTGFPGGAPSPGFPGGAPPAGFPGGGAPPTGFPGGAPPAGFPGAPSTGFPGAPQNMPPPHSHTPPTAAPTSAPPPSSAVSSTAPPPTRPPAATGAPPLGPVKVDNPNSNPEVRFVVDALNRALTTPAQGPNKPKYDDMTKRLPALINALEKGEYKPDAVTLLAAVCKAAEEGDHAGASKNMQDLGVSNLIPGAALVGIKRYVELAKTR